MLLSSYVVSRKQETGFSVRVEQIGLGEFEQSSFIGAIVAVLTHRET